MAKGKTLHLGVDQTICSLRWLPLVLTPILAFLGDLSRQEIDLILLLGLTFGGLAYNSVATLMIYLGFFPDVAAWVLMILDVVFSVGFLLATDFALFPLLTLGLFAVLEATLRLEVTVGMAVAVIVAFAAGLGTALTTGTSSAGALLGALLPAAVGVAALLLAAGSVNALVDRISKAVAHARDEELGDLRRINERAMAIYEMASALSATLDYERAINAILDISLMGLEELGAPEQKPVGMLLLYGGEGMYVATARHLKREDEDRTITGQGAIVAKAIAADKATIVRKLFRDQELNQFESLRGCQSAIFVPLRVGFDVYGAVLIASPVADAFTEEHTELVSAVCSQAVMALQNAQLYQELRDERDKIIDQYEEARSQLARDLHDGPTQSISAIAMRLNYVKALLHRDPMRVRKELDELEALARRTTREIRTMLFTLRPQILETQGLVAAVEQYTDRLQEDADFEIHLELMELGDALDINTQAVAFSIIQEAMTNVKKHSQCQNVWIRLALKDNLFVTQIQDDGIGFDLEDTLDTYDQRGSLGLLNLYDRAQLVEGKTEIVTALGKGTTITTIVPLTR